MFTILHLFIENFLSTGQPKILSRQRCRRRLLELITPTLLKLLLPLASGAQTPGSPPTSRPGPFLSPVLGPSHTRRKGGSPTQSGTSFLTSLISSRPWLYRFRR